MGMREGEQMVSFPLAGELADRLSRAASREGVSRAELLRRLVSEFLGPRKRTGRTTVRKKTPSQLAESNRRPTVYESESRHRSKRNQTVARIQSARI